VRSPPRPITTSSFLLLLAGPSLGQVTTRISVDSRGAQGNGFSENARISGDGHFVAFDSLARNLVQGDTNGHTDVFVRDRLLGSTERVSVSSTGATQAGVVTWLP
jgi:hypothetical protein